MTVLAPETGARRSTTTDLDGLRVRLIGALVVLLPLAKGSQLFPVFAGDDNMNRTVVIAPFDAVLLGLCVVAVLEGRVAAVLRRPTTAVGWAAAAFAVVYAAAFAVHPSARGVELALRIAAAWVVVDAWRRSDAVARHRLAGVVLATGAAQAALGLWQSALGHPIGLGVLEFPWDLHRFGSSAAGRGGLTHPYHLAVFLLVAFAVGATALPKARRRAPWLAGLALCGAGIAVTYSRAAVLALALACVVLLAAATRTRRLVAAVAAVSLGFALAAPSFGDGWTARYEDSAGDVSSGRSDRWREAREMADDEPLAGIGPGRYVIELTERLDAPPVLPAHNVVFHAAAELGYPGAAVVGVLAVLVVVRIRRRGALALVPVCVLAPFFALEWYPYWFPTGIVLTSIAAGVALSVEERA